MDKMHDLPSNHSQDEREVDINELLEDNNYIQKSVFGLFKPIFDGVSTHA
jgi:hypothetical protein